MNKIVFCVPIAIGSVCVGGITQIVDQRSANLGVVQLWGQEDTNDEIVLNSSGLLEVFDGQLERRVEDPISGLLETRVEFESRISLTRFRSSSFASAFTQAPEGGFNFGNAAFSNQVVFTLDSQTTFRILADLWATGPDDGALVLFEQIQQTESVIVYEEMVMNGERQIDEIIMLDAGVYRFSAINWVGVDSFGRVLDIGESSLVVDVGVVPSPSAWIFLGGGLVGMRRRR